jgi:hypothetical protein
MPVATCVQPELKLGLVAFAGTVDAEELVRTLDALRLDPRWVASYDLLWDGRGIRSLILDPDAVERVVHHGLAWNSRVEPDLAPGREAVVVGREVDFLAARLLTARTQAGRRHEVRLFDTIEDAAGWFGLAPDAVVRAAAACLARARGGRRAA